MNDEDEQGFTCETKTEFVQLNYIPIYPSSQHQPLPNNLKHTHNAPPHLSSALLDQQLISNAAKQFIEKHENNLVFNNVTRKVGKHHSDVVFESNFQSGNLEYVTQMTKKQFHLYMRADTNTRSHHQWFYFKIKNKLTRKVTLVIKNFIKSSMLYKRGLKPFAKSLKRGDIYYSQIQSPVTFEEHYDEEDHVSYSIKFQYTFAHFQDQVQFCTEPPYTHAKLNNYLNQIPFRTIQMGKSILGHKINAFLVNQINNNKPLIVVIARQHPGQTVGSWMMQGFINRLKNSSNNFAWLIVPMINIDGVMLGNNRTGLLGYDFNRHWNADQDSMRYNIFPELTGILRYFKKCRRQKSKRVKLFLDLHGHSSEPNVFSYGPPFSKQSQYYENSRLFPYLMSKKNQNFNLSQCSYEIQNSKKNCARSIFYSKLGFPYSYTIQSSFGIYNDKSINERDMLKVGEDLCSTAIQFCHYLSGDKKKDQFQQIINDMKIQNQKYASCSHQFDSDSQQEQKQEPARQELQKKINSLFKNKSRTSANIPSSLIQSTNMQQKKIISKQKSKASWQYTNSYNLSQPQVKIKGKKARSYHLKTEPFQQKQKNQKISIKNEIKLPQLNKQKIAYGNIITRRSALINSLKKVKLQDLQQINYNGNSCTIGKEIVIFNGYKKYQKS